MRKAFIYFLLILIAGAFVSCDLDALFGEDTIEEAPENTIPEEGDLTVYNNLPEDTKAAVDTIGSVFRVYEEDVSRFINGQEKDYTYRNSNGDPTSVKLRFNSWFISFKTIGDWVPDLFDRVACNCFLHNNHGYNLKELSKFWQYVELCEFRYADTNYNHNEGDLCFIELRLICDDISAKHYYAKSLCFDPTLRYEISTFGLDLLTGKHISYDYDKGKVTPPNRIVKYDDDGILTEAIDIDESGAVVGRSIYESNEEGFTTKETHYDENGKKFSETFYPGTFQGKALYRLTFVGAFGGKEFSDAGVADEKTTYEYTQDGKSPLRFSTFDLTGETDKLFRENIYTIDESGNRRLVKVQYDESGQIKSLTENRFGSGPYLLRSAEYYPSGNIKQVTMYDGTAEENVVSTSPVFEDGNIHKVELTTMDEPYEYEQDISFSTSEPTYSIYIPVHTAVGIEPSNMVVEIFAVDDEGNEIELDSSDYSIKFFGEDETLDISDEGNLVYRVPSGKWLESINVNLEKNADVDAKLKIVVDTNMILIGTADNYKRTISCDIPETTDQSFFIDFSGEPSPVEVEPGDLFWYVVEKDTYRPDLTIYEAISVLNDLVEITGVDASYDSDTWFRPNGKRNAFNLSVETDGHGSATRDVSVYFIYVQYTGSEPANVATLSNSNLRELVKVPLVFCK